MYYGKVGGVLNVCAFVERCQREEGPWEYVFAVPTDAAKPASRFARRGGEAHSERDLRFALRRVT